MGFKIKKSTITKGIVIFVVLSIAVMMGILLWSTDQSTWQQILHFKVLFIPVLVALGVVRWLADGMAFVTLSRDKIKPSIGLGRATVIRLEATLMAAIVPVLLGTIGTHAYLLNKERKDLSESMAITLLRGILPIFIFLLNIPIIFLWDANPLGGNFFNKLIEVISVPLVVIAVFFIITLFYPHKIKRVASAMVKWWGRIKFFHTEKILAVEERMFREIDQFSEIFWIYLRQKKRQLFGAILWIFLAFLIDFFIAIAILWGFGFLTPTSILIKAVAVQFLMRPIIFLAPTPGGAGIWEFTYLGFYSLFLDKSLIGISVLIWRIVMTYLPALVGAFFFSREFRAEGKPDMEAVTKEMQQTMHHKDV
jgi:uncharacterized membrane protein YbhN (UPF0104 family)